MSMIFHVSISLISVVCFIMFAKKKLFALFIPTCYLAMILAFLTDLLMFVYPLWEYPSKNELNLFIKQVMHTFALYPIVTYFFLQTLPNKSNFWFVSLHIFLWSVFAITLEWIYLKTGNMEHNKWWNLGYSYLTDWVLLIIFYFHHKWREKHGV